MSGSKVTFADFRAAIAARGLDSRITIVGDYHTFTELDLTAADLERWLDRVETMGNAIQITIGPRETVGVVRSLLYGLLHPHAMRFGAKAFGPRG